MKFPRSGSGAVAEGVSCPMKKSSIPIANSAISARSLRRFGSPSSHGPNSSTYSGAEYCKKIAFTAVVRVFAVTKSTSVAPKATPTASEEGVHHLRQLGTSHQRRSAARPERKPAICQLERLLSLIAVPPGRKEEGRPQCVESGVQILLERVGDRSKPPRLH